MTKKFMIVSGASIGVVRDGKRVTLQPGGGDEFSEDEITTINRIQPGTLRAPVNEGRSSKQTEDSEDAEDGTKTPAKKPAKKPAKGGAEPAAKPAAADDDEDI